MKKISQVLNWLSSLKIAILLLLLIAIFCAVGTAIPQQEADQFYYENFKSPRRLRPITIAKRLIIIEKKPGNCP